MKKFEVTPTEAKYLEDAVQYVLSFRVMSDSEEDFLERLKEELKDVD